MQGHRNNKSAGGKLSALLLATTSFLPFVPEVSAGEIKVSNSTNTNHIDLAQIDLPANGFLLAHTHIPGNPYEKNINYSQYILKIAAFFALALRALRVSSSRLDYRIEEKKIKKTWNLIDSTHNKYMELLPQKEGLLVAGETFKSFEELSKLMQKTEVIFWESRDLFKEGMKQVYKPNPFSYLAVYLNPMSTHKAGVLLKELLRTENEFSKLYKDEIAPKLRSLEECLSRLPILKEDIEQRSADLSVMCRKVTIRNTRKEANRVLQESWQSERFEPSGLDPLRQYRVLRQLSREMGKLILETKGELRKIQKLKDEYFNSKILLDKTQTLLLSEGRRIYADKPEIDSITKNISDNLSAMNRAETEIFSTMASGEWLNNYHRHLALFKSISKNYQLLVSASPKQSEFEFMHKMHGRVL